MSSDLDQSDEHSMALTPREPAAPSVVIIDDDSNVQERLSRFMGSGCRRLCTRVESAVALLRRLPVVHTAFIDCDQPAVAQAPIFRELARWPEAICVLMSADQQKLDQIRALGVFAPLIVSKPIVREMVEAIRCATLECHFRAPR